MAASGIQSEYLISPVVRCVSNVRPRDAHDTHLAPFSQFLKTNRINRPADTFELSTIHNPPQSANHPKSQPMTTPLLPNLAELIPVEPRPKLVATQTRLHQQLIPATNHALDIYA